jgi:hypothetical protein
MCIMTMVEKLVDLGRHLPPVALSELLDFAEFLQQKNAVQQSDSAVRLSALAGGLEHSANFAAAPLAIQEALRREWD